MRARTAFLLAVVALAAACSRQSVDRRQYQLHGQVLSVAPDRKEATIQHDAIAGFMPAMTMPYKVQDPTLLDGIAPGDVIDAILVVVSNDAFLSAVHKAGSAPLPAGQSGGPAMTARPGVPVVLDGQPIPDASFVDQDGKPVTLSSFRGQAVVLTFIYTRCPMPTMCPLMDRNFAAIQEKLMQRRELNAHLLSVTIDPGYDTPTVLKAHAKALGADPALWMFLTGDQSALDEFASRFGLAIQRNPDDPTDITHTLRTALIDRQGNLAKSYTGNEWTPEQIIGDIVVLVGVD
jgi:protein SCO1/2